MFYIQIFIPLSYFGVKWSIFLDFFYFISSGDIILCHQKNYIRGSLLSPIAPTCSAGSLRLEKGTRFLAVSEWQTQELCHCVQHSLPTVPILE